MRSPGLGEWRGLACAPFRLTGREKNQRLRSDDLSRVAEPLLLTPESGIAVLPSREGGREFRLSRGRESAGVMPLVAFAAFWTGVVALIIYAGAPLLFSIVFGALDLILLLIVLYLSFGECRIAVESGEMRVRSALLGLRTGIRVPCSSIAKISVTDSSTVTITRKDGKVLYVRWFFKRKQTADWLADEIRKEVAPWRGSPSP